MSPHVPRKRLQSQSPPAELKAARKKTLASVTPRRPTLFDDLDATGSVTGRLSKSASLKLLQASDEDDSSSLTSLSDAVFEDVPLEKRGRPDSAEVSDDEDIEFEDVPAADLPIPSGDLKITLHRDTRIDLTNPFGTKKSATKRERLVRISTHKVHVQCLLWHNAVRNSWLCDQEVQAILISHVPVNLWDEIDRWKRNSGLEERPVQPVHSAAKSKTRGKGKGKAPVERPSRDWGAAALRLEKGAVDTSHGDPLLRLMKVLVAWWRKRFQLSASGLRKQGYMSLERLDKVTRGFRSGEVDSSKYGEKIKNLDEFRIAAQGLSGSRDVGAQLFTALLRALGIEARMVASLQPVGFGWTKFEEADPEKEESNNGPKPGNLEIPASTRHTSNDRASRNKVGSSTAMEVDELDPEDEFHDSDDDSVGGFELLPPPTPTKRLYDKGLECPHFWTEALSPVTHKYLPIDAVVKGVIGSSRELIESFEPRGSKADKAKQVMAYVVGYSPDGTAKDVTVRYLKRQVWPGKTKGFRTPLQKVPVYNRHGKVKRYEEFDWFKAAMSGYVRGTKQHPFTEIDDLEDATDLRRAIPEKKEVKEGEETLQYFKTHAEYVLERHLKREEALLPNASPVRVFRNKGRGGQVNEDMVFLRSDVVQVKSAETWHKQGRAPIAGEAPLKRVPYRAATINRRRELAEIEASTGEKALQGLFSFEQTDWIVPDPIQNGIIPKNEYGNIDLFVEHMCPEGAVHVPYRGVVRICKRLGIDYAEAVVDFEFGHRMAVPVIQGVVIAEEHHDRVMEELRKDEAERSRKEDEKRQKAALAGWRKFLMGMRIVSRIQQEYGQLDEMVNVFGRGDSGNADADEMRRKDEDTAGGFLPDGYEEDEPPIAQSSSFFPVVDDAEHEAGDDFLMEQPETLPDSVDHASSTVSSRPQRKAKTAAKGKMVMRTRETESDDEDEDEV